LCTAENSYAGERSYKTGLPLSYNFEEHLYFKISIIISNLVNVLKPNQTVDGIFNLCVFIMLLFLDVLLSRARVKAIKQPMNTRTWVYSG